MNIEMVRTVRVTEISVDADEWGLYSCNEEARDSASYLCWLFKSLVNEGYDRDGVRRTMLGVMESPRLTNQGAADTEPLATLEYLLNKVFGEEA